MIEVYIDRKLAEQLARSASEAASGGNEKWLLEDVVYLFTDEQQVQIAALLGSAATHSAFFERVCDCVNAFQRQSKVELANIFGHLAEFFARAEVVFVYEGGNPPPLVPKGHRVGK